MGRCLARQVTPSGSILIGRRVLPNRRRNAGEWCVVPPEVPDLQLLMSRIALAAASRHGTAGAVCDAASVELLHRAAAYTTPISWRSSSPVPLWPLLGVSLSISVPSGAARAVTPRPQSRRRPIKRQDPAPGMQLGSRVSACTRYASQHVQLQSYRLAEKRRHDSRDQVTERFRFSQPCALSVSPACCL